jgi:hypothetical protein
MCRFIVVHERSITKCDLINNIIKTILPRSIGLFLFFYEFMALFRCPFILMAKQTNQRKRSVFNETHLQKIFFENWRTTKLCEKKRTDIGTMPWIRKKIKISLYYGAKLFRAYVVLLLNVPTLNKTLIDWLIDNTHRL